MSETYLLDGLHVVHAPAATPVVGRPPLLLVHGAGHGAWCWELWQERLPALGWESFALSLRNHPGSRPVDSETYLARLRVEDYADDVATLARHIARPCVVVGHSMGGIVVQSFAARYGAEGGALAALVLLAAVGPGQLGPLRSERFPSDVAYALARDVAAQRYFHSTDPAVRERALNRLVPESPSVMNQSTCGEGVPIRPDEIACPVLVVTAEHDHSVVPRDGRIATYYGGDWLHDAEDGHDVMLEAGWATLLDRILAWVGAHARQG